MLVRVWRLLRPVDGPDVHTRHRCHADHRLRQIRARHHKAAQRARPRITPILLMIFIPFMFAVTEVTSLGSALLPLMWGWAFAATPPCPMSARQQQLRS